MRIPGGTPKKHARFTLTHPSYNPTPSQPPIHASLPLRPSPSTPGPATDRRDQYCALRPGGRPAMMYSTCVRGSVEV